MEGAAGAFGKNIFALIPDGDYGEHSRGIFSEKCRCALDEGDFWICGGRDWDRNAAAGETAGEEKAGIQIEAGEYLSGFHKGDRLLPVITLVILFNPEPWDAPVSIHEMLSVKNPKILSFVPDYRINLIAPAQIEAEDMNKFRSSLREVLLYIKYSKDREELSKLLEDDPRFRKLDVEAAVVIDTVTNSGS